MVTSLLPLPKTQPFTTVALTVNGVLFCKSLTPVSPITGAAVIPSSSPQAEMRIAFTN